jgi:hypothetical protein
MRGDPQHLTITPSAVAFHELNALDKRSRGAVSSGRRSVHAETDPGDAWSTVLAEVTLERGVEVKFGHYRLVRISLKAKII